MEMDAGLPQVQAFRTRQEGDSLLQVLEEVDDRETDEVRPETQGGPQMKVDVTLEIPITPVPRRVRWDSRNRRMHRSNREADYMRRLRTHYSDMKSANHPVLPFLGPVTVEVTFFIHRPKRLSLPGTVRHDKRPDLENLVKPVIDAGNGILWEDDSQVWSIHARKVYHELSGQPMVRIRLSGYPGREREGVVGPTTNDLINIAMGNANARVKPPAEEPCKHNRTEYWIGDEGRGYPEGIYCQDCSALIRKGPAEEPEKEGDE